MAAPSAEVRAALERAVADGTTPGAAAVILTRAGARLVTCVGALHRGAHAPAVDEDTIYDLASLTKLLCTTLVVARAVDENKLALEEQPWPRWPEVSIEHVLRHESGLPAWAPFFEEARRRGPVGLRSAGSHVVEAVLATPPQAPPGARVLYSDLGMIALGALLEERYGCGLDDVFADTARQALGETKLRYVRLDVDGFHPELPRVAPTERCPWRRRVVHGQVHDDNCFAMGGVAGHAGLFGSLRDVEQAARALLSPAATLQRFASVPDDQHRRPLGWDRTTPGGSTGDALGPRTVGHLGFTGCSLWIDPDAGAAYALLTNRVHETRDPPDRIMALRRGFHRAAAAWVLASCRAS